MGKSSLGKRHLFVPPKVQLTPRYHNCLPLHQPLHDLSLRHPLPSTRPPSSFTVRSPRYTTSWSSPMGLVTFLLLLAPPMFQLTSAYNEQPLCIRKWTSGLPLVSKGPRHRFAGLIFTRARGVFGESKEDMARRGCVRKRRVILEGFFV